MIDGELDASAAAAPAAGTTATEAAPAATAAARAARTRTAAFAGGPVRRGAGRAFAAAGEGAVRLQPLRDPGVARGPERFEQLLVRNLQRHGQVESPAQLLGILAQIVHRARIDGDQHAIGIADETIGKRRLDRGGGRGQAGGGVVDPGADIVGDQRQIGRRHRFPVGAQLQHAAAVGHQIGVAPAQLRHAGGLARAIIEHAHVERRDLRIAELLHGGRAVLVRLRPEQAQPPGRPPVQPVAELGERAEIGQSIERAVEVGRQITDRAEHVGAAAGDRDIDIALHIGVAARQIGAAHHARPHRSRIEGVDLSTQLHRGADRPGRQAQRRSAGDELKIAAVADRTGAIRGAHGVEIGRQRAERIERRAARVDQCLQRAAIEPGAGARARHGPIVIAGHRQLPAVQRLVERETEMTGFAAIVLAQHRARIRIAIDRHGLAEGRERIAGGHVEPRTGEAAQPVAARRADIAGDGGGHVAQDRAIEHRIHRQRIAGRAQRAIGRDIGDVGGARGELPQRRPAGEPGGHACDRDRTAGQRAERRIDLGAARGGADIAGHVEQLARCGGQHIAIAFEQRSDAAIIERQVEPAGLADPQQAGFDAPGAAAALRRGGAAEFGGDRVEPRAQHEVHDLLIRAIAIFQRDLFRQDIDAQDRLGRDIAQFAEARNPLAVQQDDRAAAVAALAAAGLRGQFGEQIGDRADAVGADVGGRQRDFGRDGADDAAGRALPRHDDGGVRILLRGGILASRGRRRGRGGFGCHRLRGGRRRCLRMGGGRAAQQEQPDQGGAIDHVRIPPSFPAL